MNQIQITNCINYFNKIILNDLDKTDNKTKVFVAGGCIRDYFLNSRVSSDIDLFFESSSDFDKTVNNFQLLKNSERIYENDNAIGFKYKNLKFDLVKTRYFKKLKDFKDGFDFTVCCAALDRNNFVCNDNYFLDLATKKLIISKITYPLSSLQRIQKYIQKGFTICNEGLLTLAKEISKLEIHKEENKEKDLEFYEDGTPKFRGVD